jgi:hypothetical protein
MSLRWDRERRLAGLRGVDPHAANRATGFVHQPSTEGVDLGGQLSASVAGVNDAARLQKKRRGFDIGARTVLDTTRHDEKLRWPERNVAFAHLDFQLAVQDQEELVGVRVLVPGELTLNLHNPDVVVVIWAIFFGDQCSVRRASITSASTASMSPS